MRTLEAGSVEIASPSVYLSTSTNATVVGLPIHINTTLHIPKSTGSFLLNISCNQSTACIFDPASMDNRSEANFIFDNVNGEVTEWIVKQLKVRIADNVGGGEVVRIALRLDNKVVKWQDVTVEDITVNLTSSEAHSQVHLMLFALALLLLIPLLHFPVYTLILSIVLL